MAPIDDRDLRRELDDARADVVAAERSRQRWLRHQAEQSAAFSGTLLGLLERGVSVELRTTAGSVHQGRLTALAKDVCGLRTAAGRQVWVRIDAVTAVRTHGGVGTPPAGDDRALRQDGGLPDVLARLADDRARVALATEGTGQPIVGELRAVGADVATLVSGDDRATCYVRLPSVTEVSVLESG
jgi:hypothetical protein